MACQDYRMLISRRLDGDLDRTGMDLLEGHLAVCHPCRAVAGQYCAIKKHLAASYPPPPLPAAPGAARTEALLHPWSYFNWRFRIAAIFIAAISLFSGFMAHSRFQSKRTELDQVTLDSASVSRLPLQALVYYQEFAGQAVNTQFARIKALPVAAIEETPANQVRTLTYESPLFYDNGLLADRCQALLVSTDLN